MRTVGGGGWRRVIASTTVSAVAVAALAASLLASPLLASPAAATGGNPRPDAAGAATRGVIVSLDPAATPLARLSLMASGRGSSPAVVEFAQGAGYAATLSPAQIDALRSTPGVLAVTPNRVLVPQAAPQLERTGAPTAWAAGFRGDGQTIVIIDTGVDATNPNLAGKVVAEACFTPPRDAGGDCPNGTTTQTGAGAAAPCTGRSDCSHGTHVASTAAANGPVVFGTAPGAGIAAIRVFSSVSDPADRVITDEASVVRALEWVDAARATQPIAAVNMSLGGDPLDMPCTASPALRVLIDRLTAAGIALVASAGNDASTSGVSFPACTANVFSVGAEGRAGQAASFTNVAPGLSFFAPGESVEGAWSAPCCTRTLSGTSFAAPQVTAAFALLRQELGPGAVAARADLLRRTGDPVYAGNAGAWSGATALRVGRALDRQFQALEPAVLPRATSPIGSFDALLVDPAGFRVSGWALDPDTAAPVTVHVYVDGTFAATTLASRSRPDVGQVYAGYGSNRGFELALAVAPGEHTVCAYALDLGAGAGNVLIACRQATYGSVIGALDSAVGAAGTVLVAGWAIDTSSVASVAVELTVDDVVVASQRAIGSRPDVGAVYRGYGASHGFALSAAVNPGVHLVCVRSASAPGAAATALACRDVDVPSGEPFGVVDAIVAGPSRVSVQGWAIDPDTTRSIDVAVRIDGVVVTTVGADRARDDLVSGVPGYGASHGFSITVPVATGTHEVCVDGLDDRGGAPGAVGCAVVDVP